MTLIFKYLLSIWPSVIKNYEATEVWYQLAEVHSSKKKKIIAEVH